MFIYICCGYLQTKYVYFLLRFARYVSSMIGKNINILLAHSHFKEKLTNTVHPYNFIFIYNVFLLLTHQKLL